MKLLIILLLFFITLLNIQAQHASKLMHNQSERFKINVQKLENSDSLFTRYRITFNVPAVSDEILKSNLITCKGWIPEGAEIKKIELTGMEKLPAGVLYTCNKNNCSYKGGELGIVLLKVQAGADLKTPLPIAIRGLGSKYGFSRWYDCQVDITLY